MTAPTYEQLIALVATQERLIGQLQVRIAEQDAQIAELRRQLAASSRNSAKPPSSDGPGKPAPKLLRGRSGRKPGGQPGREGRTLRQVSRPDEVVVHEPGVCAGCGADLAAAGEPVRMSRRQVFDIPKITVRVTEHRLMSRRCGCGQVTAAAGPAGVTAPVCYGPHAAAIAVYLCLGQHLPVERTAGLLADLFGTPMSPGTVAAWTTRAAAGLEPFTAAARQALTGAEVVHVDETGLRVAGRLHWLHVACSGLFTVLVCHAKRGKPAIDAAGVLPEFTGIAVHDAFAPYARYDTATHALCNAHLLRELIAVVDHHTAHRRPATARSPPTGAGPSRSSTRCWRSRPSPTPGRCPTPACSPPSGERSSPRRWSGPPTPIRPQRSAAGTGPRRIHRRIADYLRFATDLRVPFDNNPAERDIRWPVAVGGMEARVVEPAPTASSVPHDGVAAEPGQR